MDKKNLQLLEILAQNCRVTNTSIAKALNISKDSVAYRVNQLKKTDMLKQFVLFVDARRLGFTRYHILMQFEAKVEGKRLIYDKLKKHPYVMWINTFIGRFDLQIIVDAKDGFHLNQIREELFDICNHQIKEYIILTHLFDLEFTQLLPVLDLKTKFEKKSDHSFSRLVSGRNFPVDPVFEKYSPSKSEIEILKRLADNPRESLISIGKQLNLDRKTVKSKISNLIENKVILNFGGIPNHTEFGFVTYYMLVRLSQDTPADVLRSPFQQLRNIFYAGKMIGDYDMILYLNARNPEELNSSIEMFKSQIGEHIIHYDLLVQDKVHHWKQFSEGIYRKLKLQ
jgi:DNA-binding Lrp family transcriptional regulator